MTVRLLDLLDRHAAKYEVLPAVSAPAPKRAGSPIRRSGLDLARVEVIRHGGGYAFAVLPARARVDLERLSAALRDEVDLTPESEIAAVFADCEVSALPPFGVLYGLKTYLDEALTHEREIAFHPGSRTEVIRMPFDDYRRVAAPVVLWFAESPAGAEG